MDTPDIKLVLRGPQLSRQLLNADTLITSIQNSKVLTSLRARVTTTDFAKMSLQEQIHQLAHTNVLVAVLGTALLNSLFLPADASVVFLLPYGTAKHMGWNMRRAVTFTGTAAIGPELKGMLQ